MIVRALQLFLVIFLAVPCAMKAQLQTVEEPDELEYRMFRVTLLPGLSTNGAEAQQYTAKFSLNIIGGHHGGLNGYEIGLVNMTRYYSRGLQIGGLNASGGELTGVNIAGIANLSRKEMGGMQIAVFANAAERNMLGIQAAGFVNTGVRSLTGIQLAGMGNIAGQNIQGLQIAGLFNASVENARGIMVSGFGNFNGGRAQGFAFAGTANLARDTQGFTMAGILNATRNLQGFQVSGLANIAYRARGMQIGLFNYARDFDGIPIGLVSYYNNGRKNIDTWISDGGFQNVGVKLGTRSVYNMVSIGYNPFLRGRKVWSMGWTIGSYTPLDEAWENPRYEGFFRMRDFSFQNVQDGRLSARLNSIYSYRYLIGYDLTNGFGMYAGPTLNLLVSNKARSNEYTWYSVIRGERGGNDFSFWFGFTLGMQFFGH